MVTVPAPSGGNPGTASATFTVQVAPPIPAGVLTIANAVAINDLPPPNCSNLPTPPACVLTPTMSLRITKTAQGVATTGPNAYAVTYLISVSNVGGAAAAYTLNDTLSYPAGVGFNGSAQVTSASGSVNPLLIGGQFTPANGVATQISASGVGLPPAAVHTYTLRVPVSVAAGVTNATCTGSAGNGYFNLAAITGSQALNANACAPIVNDEVGIRLVKTVMQGVDTNGNHYGDIGDILFYDFVITNIGPSPLLSVRLLDPRVTDMQCAATTVARQPLRVLLDDDVFSNPFEPIGTIALMPGDSIVCTATHTLTAGDVANRRVDNTATASGVGPQGQVTTSTSTAIFTSFQ